MGPSLPAALRLAALLPFLRRLVAQLARLSTLQQYQQRSINSSLQPLRPAKLALALLLRHALSDRAGCELASLRSSRSPAADPSSLQSPSRSSPLKRKLQHSSEEEQDATARRNASFGTPPALARRSSPTKLGRYSPTPSDTSALLASLYDDALDEESHRTSYSQPVKAEETIDTSLLAVVAQLQSVWPALSFADLLALATSLLANQPLLELAARQALAPRGRGNQSSSLTALTRLLFHRSAQGSFDFSFPPKLSLLEQADLERSAVILVAHALDLIPANLDDNVSTPAVPAKLATPRRSLCTHHRACCQCGGVLKVTKVDMHDVWVLHPSAVELATVIRFDCSTKPCGAKHWPDVVEIKQEGTRILVHSFDALYLKLGRSLYATRAFADAYIALLETNHVSSSSYAELYTRLYCNTPSTPSLAINPAHVWRAFVLHSTLELSQLADPPRSFLTIADSSTEEIVGMALETFLSDKTIPGAMEHQCPDCSRYKRRWNKGAQADKGEVAGRNRGKGDPRLVEDTTIDRSKVINMAVMDGIKIGHATCAYISCPNPPLNYTTQRFCIDHEHYHSLCGVFGCDEPRKMADPGDEEDEPTETCERADHQALWAQRVKQKGRFEAMGFGRVVRESQREKRKKGSRKEGGASEDEGEGEGEGGDGEGDNVGIEQDVGGRKALRTMWTYGTVANIQLLLYACGCPIGWEKFYTPETPSELLNFLSSVRSSSGSDQLPSFIAYDRSCHLLAAIEAEPSLHHWLTDTKFIEDAWHFAGHSKYDVLCRTFCDPAPLDRPTDLVVPMVEKGRGRSRKGDESQKRVYRRAFNTETAEQINSWLIGFAPILSKLRAENHDFLLHILLRRRFRARAEALQKKHKGVRVG